MSLGTQSYFPCWRLGYRCNPFRALTREEWSDLALLPRGLPENLEDLPTLTQLFGEQGRGKTSALLALKREFHQQGKHAIYEYLPPGSRRYMHAMAKDQVLLLDEIQRLSPRWLNKLLGELCPLTELQPQLIVSSHLDITQAVSARGIDALSISLEKPSSQFIREMVENRLIYFSRPGQEGVRLTVDALEYVIGYCASNLRLLEKLLYETYQTWESERPIEVAHIQGISSHWG